MALGKKEKQNGDITPVKKRDQISPIQKDSTTFTQANLEFRKENI